MTSENKITYDQLSKPLKAVAIYAWFSIALLIIGIIRGITFYFTG